MTARQMQAVKGFLYVQVVEAKDLPDIGPDIIDSYATIFLDDMEEGTTPPIFDSRAPQFQKQFKIKVLCWIACVLVGSRFLTDAPAGHWHVHVAECATV